MRYSGTWLTPDDEVILEYLRDHGPAGTDELTGVDVIPFSRAYVERRCAKLAGRGGLVAFEDDRYHLTGNGTAYLEGVLDPDVFDGA